MIYRLVLRLSEQEKQRLEIPFLRIGKGRSRQKASDKKIENEKYHLQLWKDHPLQSYAQTCKTYKDEQVKGIDGIQKAGIGKV